MVVDSRCYDVYVYNDQQYLLVIEIRRKHFFDVHNFDDNITSVPIEFLYRKFN